MKALLKKMLKISEEMGRLPKNGWNPFHKYKYVLESDALDHFRELCVKHGIVVLPTMGAFQQTGDVFTVPVTFDILDVDGDDIIKSIIVVGSGQDKGDKGPYKAFTGAYKYFILKTFMVPTGDDPERDEPPAKQSRRSSAAPQRAAEEALDYDPVHSRIAEVLETLRPNNPKAQADLLEETSRFETPDGKVINGVREISRLSPVRKEGKKQSRAEVVLHSLKRLIDPNHRS